MANGKDTEHLVVLRYDPRRDDGDDREVRIGDERDTFRQREVAHVERRSEL